MEELPEHIRQRFRDLKLPAADVLVLADELAVARYFDHTLAAGASPKAAANWIMGDITAFCKAPPLPSSA
jgi:aspartyl-tRNA(Asn)/glutamyl-tRNA(Gln) amidotransferase subunit B